MGFFRLEPVGPGGITVEEAALACFDAPYRGRLATFRTFTDYNGLRGAAAGGGRLVLVGGFYSPLGDYRAQTQASLVSGWSSIANIPSTAWTLPSQPDSFSQPAPEECLALHMVLGVYHLVDYPCGSILPDDVPTAYLCIEFAPGSCPAPPLYSGGSVTMMYPGGNDTSPFPFNTEVVYSCPPGMVWRDTRARARSSFCRGSVSWTLSETDLAGVSCVAIVKMLCRVTSIKCTIFASSPLAWFSSSPGERADGTTGLGGVLGMSGPMGEVGMVGDQGLQGVTGPQGLQGITGLLGQQGTTGPQGLQGMTGPSGLEGMEGVIGAEGMAGLEGKQGTTGDQGLLGVTGQQGLLGLTGQQGLQGMTGPSGLEGMEGVIGAEGMAGLEGKQGTTGDQGLLGLTGQQGLQGMTGPSGLEGMLGIIGAEGMAGLEGKQGTTGDQGLLGFTGSQGLQGITGLLGKQGTTGDQGSPGMTGDQGSAGMTGPSGMQGMAGTKGMQGDAGEPG
ncbi:unnamed protein product [Darwinula stevensoni]|uniref:Sushi domain-containing protein n=1 Tax=Darwinula stevensoni TaxID=69355 RepID=A0A7R8XCJ6_9CRUS|nr:unnamed protein product [Darwinula stevensoni]CAG0893840.1 unnamed protein product [Darwinula stevensoni]